MYPNAVSEQKGSVLVLLMMLLTGLSALWLSNVKSGYLSLGGGPTPETKNTRLLVDAQQSLLSYSILYPFLYGPRSAGPGHLPCPDTDGNQDATNPSMLRDGPDPPCGNRDWATGRLPRHAVLADQRYLFHAESAQRASYEVATAFINNPTNRVVNSGLSDRTEDGALSVAATLGVTLSDSGLMPVSLPVFQRSLMQGIRSSVAAWLIHKDNERMSLHCGEQLHIEESKESSQCASIPVIDPVCSHDLVYSLIVDAIASAELCLSAQLDQITIDAIPASRHWFVRNEWVGWIHLSASAQCAENLSLRCRLVRASIDDQTQPQLDDRHIHLKWIP